jgi:lipopolysaccharide/colanic/teichoic acid biosynthesis glycosyltransferase
MIQAESGMSLVTNGEEFSLHSGSVDSVLTVTEYESVWERQWLSFRRAAYFSAKRSVDIAISLTSLILLSPLFLLAAFMIKWHDGGPVFFRQERVGQGGRTFGCYKFRSMMINAQSLQQSLMKHSKHADPRTFKMANDPRITAPGRFLRRFSIDELPQVLNVLLGDMSIVGPRPPLPNETKLYSKFDLRRLEVKPGLTCIWQVSGRSRVPFPEQVKLDVEYISKQSLWLDFSIILRTVPAVLGGDGAE